MLKHLFLTCFLMIASLSSEIVGPLQFELPEPDADWILLAKSETAEQAVAMYMPKNSHYSELSGAPKQSLMDTRECFIAFWVAFEKDSEEGDEEESGEEIDSIQELGLALQETLSGVMPGIETVTSLIEDENAFLYECQGFLDGKKKIHAFARRILTPSSVGTLTFTTENFDDLEAKKEQWLSIFRKATLVEQDLPVEN